MKWPWIPSATSISNIGKNAFNSISGGIGGLVSGALSSATNLVGGAFDITKALSTGNFAGLGAAVTNTTSGLFSGISNSITNTISGITDPFKRVEALKAGVSQKILDTAKIPRDTINLLNTDKLTSKNFINIATNKLLPPGIASVKKSNIINIAANQLLPTGIASIKRSSAIDMNMPQILGCIGDKIKDLLGIFTVSLGIPTFDQFKLPTLTGIGDSISEAFDQAFADIQNTATQTLEGIADALSFNRLNILNQQELGRLTLSKFLGCQESLDITSKDKVNVRKDPSIIESLTNKGAEISKKALNATSIFETEQRVDKFQVIQDNLALKFKNRTDPVYIPGKYDLNVSLETSNEARGAVEPDSDTPD
jgi:predicted HicB family RNase H-like nuclease